MQESHNGRMLRELTFEEKLAWIEFVVNAYREEEEAIQRLEQQLVEKEKEFNEAKSMLEEVFEQLDQRGLVSS